MPAKLPRKINQALDTVSDANERAWAYAMKAVALEKAGKRAESRAATRMAKQWLAKAMDGDPCAVPGIIEQPTAAPRGGR